MISAARLASCRIASKVLGSPVIRGMPQQVPRCVIRSSYHPKQALVFTARHFSVAPPAFLDPAEVTDRIVAVVKNFDQVDPSKVTPSTKFAEDLGLDSLDIVEVVMAIEDEFAIEIPDQEADKILSIADAVEYISSHPMAK